MLIIWVFPALACTRSVISPRDLTATAIIARPTELAILSPQPTSNAQGGGAAANLFQDQVATLEATPLSLFTPTPIPTQETTPKPPVLYYTQAGDTLSSISARFGVAPAEIKSSWQVPPDSVLTPNRLLIIPDRLPEFGPGDAILPDSEVVYSPSAVDFDIHNYVAEAGGYLSTYREWLANGWNSGADVIQRVAIENSINPRILLALIEYQSNWVTGQPQNLSQTDYPMGYQNFAHLGLYKQLSWAVQQLSIGYYGWRAGILTEIDFPMDNNTRMRLAPGLNAGSAALQILFSRLYNQRDWGGVLYAPDGFPVLYDTMFGNPWLRAQTVEPLYPPTLTQPDLTLPFRVGRSWSLTGGPHSAWGPDGALAALDFAPSSLEHGCVASDDWVTAVAAGKVVRVGNGVVVIDLDGDGYEQTGWSILYLHVATKDRIALGSFVHTNDLLGHPSCEGGVSTGTHVHIARKYNGEWILASGPISFNLDGWTASAGEKPYEGLLTKNDQVVEACTCGSAETLITRTDE